MSVYHYVDGELYMVASSTRVYHSYNHHKMEYKPCTCKNCGAPLTRRINGGMICEYCDTIYMEG